MQVKNAQENILELRVECNKVVYADTAIRAVRFDVPVAS